MLSDASGAVLVRRTKCSPIAAIRQSKSGWLKKRLPAANLLENEVFFRVAYLKPESGSGVSAKSGASSQTEIVADRTTLSDGCSIVR